jgi:hypothetical protein
LCIQRILEKYDAEYFQCPQCDLIQTEFPYWFEEAPWSAIAHFDTGAVMRHASCVRMSIALAQVFDLDPTSRCLDYGAGSGLFVRSMRDRGFDFRWWDLYAPNVHAKGFEAQPDDAFNLVTAFELFEHLPDVRAGISPILGSGHEIILVGTVLHKGHEPGWWYYVPELGGHVSFYSERTMRFIAEQWGYQVAVSPRYTVFFRRLLSARRVRLLHRLLSSPRVEGILFGLAPGYETLVSRDYAYLLPEFLPSAPTISPLAPLMPASRRQRAKQELALQLAGLMSPVVERMLDRTQAIVRRASAFGGSVAVTMLDQAVARARSHDSGSSPPASH